MTHLQQQQQQQVHGIVENDESNSDMHFEGRHPHEPHPYEPNHPKQPRPLQQQQPQYLQTQIIDSSSSVNVTHKVPYSTNNCGNDSLKIVNTTTNHYLTTSPPETNTNELLSSAVTTSSNGDDLSHYSFQSQETDRLSWTSSSAHSSSKDSQGRHPPKNAIDGHLSRSKPSMNSFSSYSSSGSRNNNNNNSSHCHSSSYTQSQQETTTHSGTTTNNNNKNAMRRSHSRSVFSDAEMTHAQSQTLTLTKYFGHDVNRFTNKSPEEPIFDSTLRNFIEPHISKARKAREEQKRLILEKLGIDGQTIDNLSIASNAFVPYPGLRIERPFLFDVETYPLHQILADTLNVSDLSLIHQHPIQDKRTLLSPLLDEKKRRAFHQCYDNFVQTFCIPLLHSLAISQKMFHEFSRNPHSEKIYYRYQAFPCLRVIRPDEFSIGPHCDMAYGHSIGNINFHIPLTPTYGTNCVYTESHPGREDWHPLKTKSVGLGYVFDGARCLHFTLENTTSVTRVSLDFRIAIYRDRGGWDADAGVDRIGRYGFASSSQGMMQHTIASHSVPRGFHYPHQSHHHGYKRSLSDPEYDDGCNVHDCLCHPKILEDNFSVFPGYYEEAFIDMGRDGVGSGLPGSVVQKKHHMLIPPDKRVGFPF